MSFEEAVTVFQDPLANVHEDPDHSLSEKREILVGHSLEGRLLLVASPTGVVESGSSARAPRRVANIVNMKKPERRDRSKASEDLRPEHSFDYSKARPNPYAARLKGRAVAVVLDPDVASVFGSSEAVNTALRAVVAAVPRRSSTRKR